ncbi:hypothetical protein FRC08_011921 [Ceratobasidium sp. 394]|nr:hypothetical protein FRC08_011921 [Ceratobasidium sp. 394]KAG9090278.1 hypothetical protein FS749_000672 [Ceratobasidium sp. UAMH 11750]
MSQGSSNGERQTPAQELATAVVDHITEHVVESLEGQVQAQDAWLDQLYQDVHAWIGSGAPQRPGPSSGRTSRQKKGGDVPRPDKTTENLMQTAVRFDT